MEQTDTPPESSGAVGEQSNEAGRLRAMKSEEQKDLEAATKYKKENIGKVNWHVEEIIKGNKKTKFRDVTALVMEVITEHDIHKALRRNRYKCALAHCINAKPTKTEGNRPTPYAPGQRTLETMSTMSTTEYDYKILQASSFFRIRVASLNTMLLELEQKISLLDLPVLDRNPTREPGSRNSECESDAEPAGENGGDGPPADATSRIVYNPTMEDLAEVADVLDRALEDHLEEEKQAEGEDPLNETKPPDLANASALAGPSSSADVPAARVVPVVDPARARQGNRLFTGDMLDPTKSRYEAFRSFVDQIFYWVDDPYEKEVLEWVVKCMVDPHAYNDVPNIIMRDKVLEYFKVMLPSLHCSPFEIEPVWFKEYLTKDRVIKINRDREIDEEGTEEDQLELAAIVDQVMAERREMAVVAKEKRKKAAIEKKEREEQEAREKAERRKQEAAERRVKREIEEAEDGGDEEKAEEADEENEEKPEMPVSDGDMDRSFDERDAKSSFADDEDEEEEEEAEEQHDISQALRTGVHHEETIETESLSPVEGSTFDGNSSGSSISSVYDSAESSDPARGTPPPPAAPAVPPCARNDHDLYDSEVSRSLQSGGVGSGVDDSVAAAREERLDETTFHSANEDYSVFARTMSEGAEGGENEAPQLRGEVKEEVPEEAAASGRKTVKEEPIDERAAAEADRTPLTMPVIMPRKEVKKEPAESLREDYEAAVAEGRYTPPTGDSPDQREIPYGSRDSTIAEFDLNVAFDAIDEEEEEVADEQEEEEEEEKEVMEKVPTQPQRSQTKKGESDVDDEEIPEATTEPRRSPRGQAGWKSKLPIPTQPAKKRKRAATSDEDNEEEEEMGKNEEATLRRSPRGPQKVTPTIQPKSSTKAKKEEEEPKSVDKRRSSKASEATPSKRAKK